MTIPRADRRVRKPERVVLRTVGSESVLLDTETGRYFALNDIGTRVWAQLQQEASVARACDALCLEFDADRHQVESDVNELLAQLEAEGLVEVEHVEP